MVAELITGQAALQSGDRPSVSSTLIRKLPAGQDRAIRLDHRSQVSVPFWLGPDAPGHQARVGSPGSSLSKTDQIKVYIIGALNASELLRKRWWLRIFAGGGFGSHFFATPIRPLVRSNARSGVGPRIVASTSGDQRPGARRRRRSPPFIPPIV